MIINGYIYHFEVFSRFTHVVNIHPQIRTEESCVYVVVASLLGTAYPSPVDKRIKTFRDMLPDN